MDKTAGWEPILATFGRIFVPSRHLIIGNPSLGRATCMEGASYLATVPNLQITSASRLVFLPRVAKREPPKVSTGPPSHWAGLDGALVTRTV